MIVYMIQCRTTGRWRNFDMEWYDKQEDGSVWGNKEEANAALNAIPQPHAAVKRRYALSYDIEGIDHNDVVVVNGHTWAYDAECSTWIYGVECCGCGVYGQGKDKWYARIVVEDATTEKGPYSHRDVAMQQAIDFLNRQREE